MEYVLSSAAYSLQTVSVYAYMFVPCQMNDSAQLANQVLHSLKAPANHQAPPYNLIVSGTRSKNIKGMPGFYRLKMLIGFGFK
jgi:hypothetical protein